MSLWNHSRGCRPFFLVLALLAIGPAAAQDLVINEFLAKNTTSIEDEDGSRADWIELYNAGTGICLNGYALTDDPLLPHKWVFPATTMAAKTYLLVFASDKDRTNAGNVLHANFKLNDAGEYLALVAPDGSVLDACAPAYPTQHTDVAYGRAYATLTVPRTLLSAGAACRAQVPASAVLGTNWWDTGFDDATWMSGFTGVGYDLDTTYVPYMGLDVRGPMYVTNTTVYVRVPFVLDPASTVVTLSLGMYYDDGYAAYLNGTCIASGNVAASLVWNAAAPGNRADTLAVVPEWRSIAFPESLLVPGTNVLAIHGLNNSLSSSDFLVMPLLEATILVSSEYQGIRYLTAATPGSLNSDGFLGVVDDTSFSTDRGIFFAPTNVAITCITADADIFYTLDGSPPSTTSFRYASPIVVTGTTILRAAAFKATWRPSNVDTHTYLFPEQVVHQPVLPGGFPATWGPGVPADYEMDPEIVMTSLYSEMVAAGITSIPSLSVVMPLDDLLGPTGIYVNPTTTGDQWERAASAELIGHQGQKGFHISCGAQVEGNASRTPLNSPKHSFSLRFRGKYGATKLEYPLFDGAPVTRFDSLQLRGVYNNSWIHREPVQRARGMLVRDQFARECLRAMGHPDAGRGAYVHLYLNGLYWGVYNIHERPEASHYAAWNGGSTDQLDARNGSTFTDGSVAAWFTMASIVATGSWQQVQQVLDVDNYIDWTLLERFVRNSDLQSGGNWRAAGGGIINAPWHFYSWDTEHSLEEPADTSPCIPSADPPNLLATLRTRPDFAVRYADRIQLHAFNGGALAPESCVARLLTLARMLVPAIVCESARWGDHRRDLVPRNPPDFLCTYYDHWLPELARLTNAFFPGRTTNMLARWRADGYFPALDAPVFSRHGGSFTQGFLLAIAAATSVFYTVDGSDPRQEGSGIPAGMAYANPLAMDTAVTVKARAFDGATWSALAAASFFPERVVPLRVTELMYHPADPPMGSPYLDNDFEFIEIRNIGTAAYDLAGVSLSNGVSFTFPPAAPALGSGAFAVLVHNLEAFTTRYDATTMWIAGIYSNELANGSDSVTILDAEGIIVLPLTYHDTWHPLTDGLGFSLTIVDDHGVTSLWSVAEGWRPSSVMDGTPGMADVVPEPCAVLLFCAWVAGIARARTPSRHRLAG